MWFHCVWEVRSSIGPISCQCTWTKLLVPLCLWKENDYVEPQLKSNVWFSFFFKYIVSFARFKLFQWPLWGFLSWTEGYQQFCSRVRVLGSIFPLLGLKWQISSGWFKNTWSSGSSSCLMLTFVPVLFCSWPPDGWISAGLWLATVMEDCAGMAAWNQRRKKKEGKKKRKVQITITYVPPQVLTAQ